jgi:type I restriction enzyme S subunit
MHDHYQQVFLEDIAYVLDPQPDHRAPRFVEGGFPYVGIGDIDVNGRIRHEQCRKVSELAVLKQEQAFQIEYEDIAFGKVGTVGKVVSLKEPERYAVSATLVIIKPKGNVNRHFLFHLLQSEQTSKGIRFSQTGTTRATLGIQQIRKLAFVVPSLLSEQHHIAEVLDTIDAQIQETEKLIAKLKLMQTGLLQTLLTCGIDKNGQVRDPVVMAEAFEETPLGNLPKAWKVGKIDDLAFIIDPQPDHRAPAEVVDGIPYIGVGDFFPDGTINFNSCRKVSLRAFLKQKQRFSIEFGDIVFGKIGTIGLPRLLPSEIAYALSANTVLIKPKQKNTFLLWLLKSSLVERQIQAQLHSTSQPAFGIQRIRSLSVPLPCKNEQEKIAERLDSYDTCIRAEEAYLTKLRLLKPGLMQDLLTGQVRVPVSLLKRTDE